jgi:hypothetical protein
MQSIEIYALVVLESLNLFRAPALARVYHPDL